MAQINYFHSRRNAPIAKKVLKQPSKETGFLWAFWWGDRDGLKKPGFSVAPKQPSKETGFLVGANARTPLLGWVTNMV